ncbi:hypothetical protein JCM16303_006414 [Sporobolomyces ruberrimus]
MFRQGTPTGQRNNKVVLAKSGSTSLKHHPILEYVDLASDSFAQMVPSVQGIFHFIDRRDQRDIKFSKLPCMDEYATSPPCRKVVWKGLHEEEVNLVTERKNGVKVKELLRDVFKMWKSETSDAFREKFVEQLEKEMQEEDSEYEDYRELKAERRILLDVLDVRLLTYMMAIPQMTRIDRMRSPEVIEDDCVRLHVEWATGEIWVSSKIYRTQRTAPPRPVMASLVTLPHETLLDPHLVYSDLKNVTRVCRLLHRLEQDPQLDAKMFRKGFPDARGGKFILARQGATDLEHHPLLNAIDLTSKSLEEIEPILREWDYCDSPQGDFSQLPCMDEYATSPPSCRIVWEDLTQDEHFTLSTERASGVKVKDLLTDVFKMWDSDTSWACHCEYVESLEREMEEEEESGESSLLEKRDLIFDLHYRNLSHRETIPEATVIDQLDEPKVIKDDVVQLRVSWMSVD